VNATFALRPSLGAVARLREHPFRLVPTAERDRKRADAERDRAQADDGGRDRRIAIGVGSSS